MNNSNDDLISRREAIRIASGYCHPANVAKELAKLPSVQPDNRLSKIADLVDGTIDHFDLDDAIDLLYQIKEVLK